MKSNSILVLACLVSTPVLAQTLPDEINYGPYETRYRSLEREVSSAQTQLGQSRSSLQEAQRFIAEMTGHISELEDQIRSAEAQIRSLRQEIPELERRISIWQNERSRAESEIRSLQSEEDMLENRRNQVLREMRPLEEAVARKEQRYRELHVERAQYQKQEKEAEARLNRALKEAQRIDTAMNQERNQQRQMEQELQNIDSRIRSVEVEITRTETSLSSLNANLASERSKLASLESRVQEYQSQVTTLRSSGAPAEQIKEAERKLGAAMNSRNNTAGEVKKIESEIKRSEAQVRTLRAQIEEIRRSQTTLPGRIAQSEVRQRQLTTERGQTQGEINRHQNEVAQVRRQVETRDTAMASIQQELSVAQAGLQRQRQVADGLSRQIQAVRSDIESLSNQSRRLSSQIAEATERIRSHQGTIPRMEQGIRRNEQEISEGESDLVRARSDERKFSDAVARDEAKLADLTRSRDSAQNEMSQRLSLFNRYLTEAKDLGTRQADSGTALGRKEGARLSQVLSRQNGAAAGQELGKALARHWGSVRGEIQGYEKGHAEGMASVEDRIRAIQEASSKAALDAELFAQRNFKPVFFEEFVQAEFKRPMVPVLKSLQSLYQSVSLEGRMETVPPLNPSEIARSEDLKTPLDASIITAAKEVKTAEERSLRLSDPEIAFETPTKLPFGTVACSQVYKGLAIFKSACEGSYKDVFTSNYVSAAREEFLGLYQRQFESEFDTVNISIREENFPREFSEASKIARAEGVRVGKVEIYQQTYESTYKSSYETEIVKAKVKAKGDAGRELTEFLKAKPLLTVAETTLAAENFRGGEEVNINGKVKNVGLAPLKGPVMVRITEVINARAVMGEVVLSSAAPQALTDLPPLKVQVNSSARAGEKVIVRGVVELPGDLYRSVRQEKFELTQILSANPAHELGLNYNKTPAIKGVFRRYIHFLSVTVTPKVEEIKDGYQVTLKAVGENSTLIEQKETILMTGTIAQNSGKEVRFSYGFKDVAQGKNISLELSVLYGGKILKKEMITLTPQ